MAAMATHTLVNYGYFETSFGQLHPKQDKYWTKDGTEHPVKQPSDEFAGIHFGFMQKRAGAFLIVKVDELVLRAPVLFASGRHGPAAPGPAWSPLDDDVAAQILADAIVANPEYRDLLAQTMRSLTPAT